MKEFEIRKTKGYCRVCELSSEEKMVMLMTGNPPLSGSGIEP